MIEILPILTSIGDSLLISFVFGNLTFLSKFFSKTRDRNSLSFSFIALTIYLYAFLNPSATF